MIEAQAVAAQRATLEAILPLRGLYLQAMNTQIRYDAVHSRGWANHYVLTWQENAVGYAAVKGLDDRSARDTVFEMYVVPSCRNLTRELFASLRERSHATFIECQSNDSFLSEVLFAHAVDVRSETVLFADHCVTAFTVPDISTRARHESDHLFEHTSEPVGDIVAVSEKEVVGSAGFLCHYNPPFADLYMEVRSDHRRRGIGALLIQEAKVACYLAGRVPAARCGASNVASQATLIRAGLRQSGRMLVGRLAPASPVQA